MTPYRVTYRFYYDGKLETSHSGIQLLETPKEEEISGNDFDSLWDLTHKWYQIPYNAYEFKKGKRFLEFYNKTFARHVTPKNCKPWKFTITSTETTISMERLMQFNTEDVIQYLKERGMNVCPIKENHHV